MKNEKKQQICPPLLKNKFQLIDISTVRLIGYGNTQK